MKNVLLIVLGLTVGFGLGQVHKNEKAKEVTTSVEQQLKQSTEPALKSVKNAIKSGAKTVADSL